MIEMTRTTTIRIKEKAEGAKRYCTHCNQTQDEVVLIEMFFKNHKRSVCPTCLKNYYM